jgi:hypothetical protein
VRRVLLLWSGRAVWATDSIVEPADCPCLLWLEGGLWRRCQNR